MASFDTSHEKITLLGGRLISVQKAERLVNSLESAIETAHEYEEWDELHDIGLNDRALNHLLDPTDKDYTLHVGVSYDTEEGLAMDYLDEILKQSEKYGHLDATINACDVRPFFEASSGITGFSVELPER